MHFFEGILFFKAMNDARTNSLVYTSSCMNPAGSWCDLFCFYIVHSFENKDSIQNLYSVLFCLIKKCFFVVVFLNLSCVFDLEG